MLAIQTRDTRHETRDTRHETAYSDSSGLPPSGLPLSLSPQVAYLIADILSDRYARMRAFGLQSTLDVDRPAAAKTGTTSDWRDNWAMGFSPDRAVGVWVGNANGQPMRAVSGIDGAGPVWHDVMLAAHRGLPPRPFPRPPGIVERAVCAEAGLLPTASCPATRLERFVVGTEPQRDALAASTDAPSASGAPAARVARRWRAVRHRPNSRPGAPADRPRSHGALRCLLAHAARRRRARGHARRAALPHLVAAPSWQPHRGCRGPRRQRPRAAQHGRGVRGDEARGPSGAQLPQTKQTISSRCAEVARPLGLAAGGVRSIR